MRGGWRGVMLLVGLALPGCKKNQPAVQSPSPVDVPPSVVAYLDSLRQGEDSLLVQLFESLIQEGFGEVLFYHLFLDTTFQNGVDSLLSPDLRDSLREFLQNPPPESLQAAYVVAVDSIWDALLHPPQPPRVRWDTLDYDEMITPDLLPFPDNILKKLGLLRFGKEVERVEESASTCFRMSRNQYTRLRSTVGTVVSCVEYGVWSNVFSPRPGVYKRARHGILHVVESHLTILQVSTPVGTFASCAEGGRGCAGWVRILDRWMLPSQFHPDPPPRRDFFFSSVERASKLHPLAVICALLGGFRHLWIPAMACVVFTELSGNPDFPGEEVAIYRYDAPPVRMETMEDTVDYYFGDPVEDELQLTWEIHLYRPPDTSDWVVHCEQHKQFRVPGGPTDPTRNLECAAVKTTP